MKCPHCRTDLRRRERTGHRCSACKRRFALDPGHAPLSDLRLLTLVDRLNGGGRFYYTTTQLLYAIRRPSIRVDASIRDDPPQRTPVAVVLALAAISIGVCATGVNLDNYVLVAPSVLFALMAAVAYHGWRHPDPRDRRVLAGGTAEEVDRNVVTPWVSTYGEAPNGLIRSYWDLPESTVDAPVGALLCPDASVLECLRANGVPQRLALTLGRAAADVPPDVPVILLHDVGPAGFRWATGIRSGLPGRRIRDATPPVGTVRRARTAIRLCDPDHAPDADELAELTVRMGLGPNDTAWLAEGWWSPVAALPPALLIARVEAAARRFDPAAEVGYLTWPAPVTHGP